MTVFSEMPTWQRLSVVCDNGITEVTMHRDGGALIWDAVIHRELAELFAWLAFERTTKIVLLTGTGEDFCAAIDSTQLREMPWRDIWAEGRRLLCGMLDLDALVITAVNGPALIHSEIAVMADIVMACPEATFADHAHFTRDVVPGDGVQLVWRRLLGPSRASYFLLTGEVLSADEALRLGVVHELHPRDILLSRARELARRLAEKSAATVQYTRTALRLGDRRDFRDELSHGLAIEGLAQHAMGLRQKE